MQFNSLSSLPCILSFSLSPLRLRHCQSPKNIFYELSYHSSNTHNRFQKHIGQKIPLLFSNLKERERNNLLTDIIVVFGIVDVFELLSRRRKTILSPTALNDPSRLAHNLTTYKNPI